MIESNNKKVVAIVGRPNVGKSTLFNRLVGKRVAIETAVAGTTRDTIIGDVSWRGQNFKLVDLAGIETGSKKEIDQSIQEGVELAIAEADLILFLVDWTDKDNDMDKFIARRFRRKANVILVVNKADNIERQKDIKEFDRLGVPPIVPVSAISGKSSGDLLDVITSKLKKIPHKTEKREQSKFDFKLAIIGRPNVGKSTLLNSIIGQKRAVVSSEAGTTRDIVNILFHHKGKIISISDTAGLRRPGKIKKDTIESFSVLRTHSALKDADVAILLIDATEGLVALDANILGKAKEIGKGLILAVNKIDEIKDDQKEYMAKTLWILQEKLNFVPWIPVVFISAMNKENIRALLDRAVNAFENRNTKISQEDLNIILEEAQKSNPQLLSVKSLCQSKTTPPIFKVGYSRKRKPHYTQIRYLENKIRDVFPMSGSPIFIDEVEVISKKKA